MIPGFVCRTESVPAMTVPSDDILDLLVAYALDALEPEEVARVIAWLEEDRELRNTLAELRATANRLPYALADASPPPDLRQRVLERATKRAEPQRQSTPAGPAQRARGWLVALGSLATAAVLIAAIGWARLAGAEAELARMRTELATLQAEQRRVAEVMAQPEAVARLIGTNGSGMFMRTPSGGVILATQLPPLQPGRVYQLWLIQGNNPPISGGTFTVDRQGHGLLALEPTPHALAADTIAVTDEPEPGSPSPTTAPLIIGRLTPPDTAGAAG